MKFFIFLFGLGLTGLLYGGVSSKQITAEFSYKACGIFLALEGPDAPNTIDFVNNLEGLQSLALKMFEKNVVPKMKSNPSPFKTFPGGIDSSLVHGFEKLWEFVRDPLLAFKGLQALERETVLYSLTLTGEATDKLAIALEHVLSKWEAQSGFAKPVIVSTFLPNSEFLKLLAKGHPVSDDFFLDKPHSRDGHRIMEAVASVYIERVTSDRTLYSRMYRYMGDPSQLPLLDWSETGVDLSKPRHPEDAQYIDLHGYFWDTPFHSKTHACSPSDWTNLEFVSTVRPYLPFLTGWK